MGESPISRSRRASRMERPHERSSARHASTSSTTSSSSMSSVANLGLDDAASVSSARVSDVERRSFLRAYSRKSLESNPEDEEFVVGDDGTINRVAVDDRARIERLRQLLEKKERETRQAAEYGLSLLESNEELHVEIESLKIQHEAETAELAAERDLYRRRHELSQQEVETWMSESKRQEELKYQLSNELETLAARCECQQDGSRTNFQRQQHRIAELESTVAELQSSEASNTAVIRALKKWKSLAESEQREKADLADDEACSEKLYTQKLERDITRLKQQVESLSGDKMRLEREVEDAETLVRTLRTQIDELHQNATSQWKELHEKEEQLLTAESRCGRLERERAIMEQVANLPVAVYEDDDDDDDEDDEEDDDVRDDAALADDQIEDPTTDEQWFTQDREGSKSHSSLLGRTSSFQLPPYVPAGDKQRVPPTPSSMATHQKLHHYFHLTALSIIHENNLHERCFDSSSRSTIDTWYQEVLEQGVQFLGWHAWLINRISAVAAAMQSEEEQALERSGVSRSTRRGKRGTIVEPSTSSGPPSASSNSPFRAFLKRRESSRSGFPPPQAYGAPPSTMPPTPRVSSSVAWSFFSRLVGRRDNQDATDE